MNKDPFLQLQNILSGHFAIQKLVGYVSGVPALMMCKTSQPVGG
jgi:hypothetical protein